MSFPQIPLRRVYTCICGINAFVAAYPKAANVRYANSCRSTVGGVDDDVVAAPDDDEDPSPPFAPLSEDISRGSNRSSGGIVGSKAKTRLSSFDNNKRQDEEVVDVVAAAVVFDMAAN